MKPTTPINGILKYAMIYLICITYKWLRRPSFCENFNCISTVMTEFTIRDDSRAQVRACGGGGGGGGGGGAWIPCS